jgi:hypothetical protein
MSSGFHAWIKRGGNLIQSIVVRIGGLRHAHKPHISEIGVAVDRADKPLVVLSLNIMITYVYVYVHQHYIELFTDNNQYIFRLLLIITRECNDNWYGWYGTERIYLARMCSLCIS